MSVESNIPSVIIDNGSANTKAGFSTDELPSLVFPSVYSKNTTTNETVVGHDINKYPENEVFTLLNDGLIYNWDQVLDNWNYIYDNLKVNADEFPLVLTENTWNTKKNKLKTCELVFENMNVPVFSLVKNPLCITYGVGRSTGLVIDIGSSIASVTPILDGTILTKSVKYSKLAGDYLNLHILNFLESRTNINNLISKPFDRLEKISQSFKTYQISQSLVDYKTTMIGIPDQPPNQYRYHVAPRDYQLNDGTFIRSEKEQHSLADTLFQPQFYPIPSVPQSKQQELTGISTLILSSLRSIENKGGMEIYQNLLSSIIMTGGSTLISGFNERIQSDLARFLPQAPAIFYESTNSEKLFGNWIGASILSSISNNYDNLFISKKDYEEYGEDLIVERFK